MDCKTKSSSVIFMSPTNLCTWIRPAVKIQLQIMLALLGDVTCV